MSEGNGTSVMYFSRVRDPNARDDNRVREPSADALKGVNSSSRSTLLHMPIARDIRNLSRSHLTSSCHIFDNIELWTHATTMAKRRSPALFSYSINLRQIQDRVPRALCLNLYRVRRNFHLCKASGEELQV